MKHYCCEFTLNLQMRKKCYLLTNDIHIFFILIRYYLVLGFLYSRKKYCLRNSDRDQQVSMYDMTVGAELSAENKRQYIVCIAFCI